MKRLFKILALFLIFAVIAGCGNKNSKGKNIDITMNAEETQLSQLLIDLYSNPTAENINELIFNITDEMSEVLLQQLDELKSDAAAEGINVKETGSIKNMRIYAVSVKYSGNSDSFVVNDALMISQIEDKNYIVLQQMYGEEAQEDIIDAYILHEQDNEYVFSAYKKEVGISDSRRTSLSISEHVQFFKDSEENNIAGKSGFVYSTELSLSEIEQGNVNYSDLNGVDRENFNTGNGGLSGNYLSNGNSQSDEPALQKRSDGRSLVWNLEFDTSNTSAYSSLNTNIDTMAPNNSTLFVSTSKENYFIEDGDLVLRITKNKNTDTYTTARSVTTADRMSFKYGYLEMRAMVPYQKYVWPSFWLQPDKKTLSNDFKYYSEIDIFEVFGSSNTAVFNLHKWYDGYAGTDMIGNRGNYTGSLKYKFKNSSALSKEYHLYGFEWTPEYMKAYIDGECYYQVYIKEEDDYSTEHPGMECFHDYHYICWNNWVYADEAQGRLEGPVDYRIDYVRLYQNTDKEFIKLY